MRADPPIAYPDGSEVTVVRRPVDLERDPLELHWTIGPSSRTPPHSHPGGSEELAVQTGRIEVLLGGRWRPVSSGQSLVVPPGCVHTYRNRSGSPARAISLHTPAGNFGDFVDRAGRMAAAGQFGGLRGRLLIAMLWTGHEDSFRLARASDRAGNSLLAAIGRASGLQLPDPEGDSTAA